MWRKIKVVFVLSVVTLSLGMTISSSFAQVTPRDGAATATTTTRDRDNGFDLGWIGLAGLAGLVGLMPRNRDHRNDHELRR